MVYDYVITLKKPDYRFVDQVSQLMYLFALLVFGFAMYKNQHAGLGYFIYTGIFVAAIVGSWILCVLKKRAAGFAYYRVGLFMATIGFLAMGNYWMAALYAIAGLLEKQVKFPQEIGFSTREIAFNSFPKKRYQWSDLNNVIIKDGLITIDQKNNKLLQKEINEDVPAEVEKEFNAFCKAQLKNINQLAG